MPYIIISATGIILAALLLTGYSSLRKVNQEKETVGISLLQSHMNYTDCFSFFLRREREKVLFDAQVTFYDNSSIILERIEIDSEYFEQLLLVDKRREITENVLKYKAKPSLVNALDETVVTTTVYFNDGSDKSAKSYLYDKKLYEFFMEIAKLHKDQSVT